MICECGHDFFDHYAQGHAPEISGVVKQCKRCSDCDGFTEREED